MAFILGCFYEELEQLLCHFRKASTYTAKMWLFLSAVSDAGAFDFIGPRTRAYKISHCIRPFISHVNKFKLFYLRSIEVVRFCTTFIVRKDRPR
jgi:hypothetical protein